MHVAIKIPVIESERGYGSKVDDYMICKSVEDANTFIKEFNSKNNESSTPDWYMYAEQTLDPIDLNDEQYNVLLSEGNVWLSKIKNI
jgi:hypothetical protein